METILCEFVNLKKIPVKMPCIDVCFKVSKIQFFRFYHTFQVLITSDISGQLWNACVWDLNTGTSLTSYKGESTNHHGLCVLANQYLLGASCSKPLIFVWALQRRVWVVSTVQLIICNAKYRYGEAFMQHNKLEK